MAHRALVRQNLLKGNVILTPSLPPPPNPNPKNNISEAVGKLLNYGW